MKKATSLLIILLTILLTFFTLGNLVFAYTYNTDTTNINLSLFQYYDNETTGNDAPIWNTTIYFKINETIFNGSSGKSVKATGIGGQNANIPYATLWGGARTSGNISYEFDINVIQSNSLTQIQMYAGGASGSEGIFRLHYNYGGSWYYWDDSYVSLGITSSYGWNHIKVTCDTATTNCQIQINNSAWSSTTSSNVYAPTSTGFAYYPLENDLIYLDNFIAYNGTSIPKSSGIVTLYNLNCTSCNEPNGDTTPPYTTADTTPTFTFVTNPETSCRIANQNYSYTQMNTTRECTSGQGTSHHICTLQPIDELIYPTSYVYIACSSGLHENSSGALQMEITNLIVNSSIAIWWGIESSEIWPGATVYDNQKVYLRSINNSQLLITVDKVAAYGNQRWIFNYVTENETKINSLFNITPAVYVWQSWNLSLSEIQGQVSDYINSTKT